MNARRLLASLAVLGVWLAAPAPAGAHRLDEYLQATRLSLDIGRVDLEIDLTAGVSLASALFAWIDTNGDGQISDSEGEAYARQILRSVSLSVDDRPAPLVLVESRFPPFQDMSLGVGTIGLRATANVPAAGFGRHSVVYSNTHRPEQSVYLVNALVPADSRIQIAGQRRDTAQHEMILDYDVTASVLWTRIYWLFAALTAAAVLGVTRWPRRQPVTIGFSSDVARGLQSPRRRAR